MVIAYFVGGQQTKRTLSQWLRDISQDAKEELTLGRELGQGFFQIVCKNEAATQKDLMRTPHHSKWGTNIIQPWCLGFNPKKLEKMKMPV